MCNVGVQKNAVLWRVITKHAQFAVRFAVQAGRFVSWSRDAIRLKATRFGRETGHYRSERRPRTEFGRESVQFRFFCHFEIGQAALGQLAFAFRGVNAFEWFIGCSRRTWHC